MPRRIVVHGGFHKTGTSTVQQVLKTNRAPLKAYLRPVLKPSMKELLHAARGYSTWRDPLTLDKFARRFRALLEGIGAMPRRTLCLSAEELSGHLPGRSAIADYAAAPELAAEMARIAKAVYPGTELIFFYSTRDPETWLRSAYWEQVKSSSLTLGWDAFAERYRSAADLDRIVDAVAAAQSNAVHRAALEHTAAGPAGPAGPVLELCGVPAELQRSLAPVAPVNERRDEAVLLALLAANRDYVDRDARKTAKKAILEAARREVP